MGRRLLLCLVALSGNAYAVAVPPVIDLAIPSVAATPVISGAKSAIPSAIYSTASHFSAPLAPTSTSAIDNSTAQAIFVAGIPKSALMPLAQLLSTIVNTLIGLITKNYADVVSVTNNTAPLATAAPAIVPRDPQLDVVGVLNGVGKGLNGVISDVANVVAVTQTNGLGQVVGTVLAAVPSGVNNLADAIPIIVPGVTNTVADVTNSKLTSTLLSNPIAAIQLAISSLVATLFGGGDQGTLLNSLQTTLNNLLTKRDGARDFQRKKRQEYAPPPDTRGPYSPEVATPVQSSSASFSPVTTGAGSADAVTPGVIAPLDSLTPLQDVPTSLAALDYLGSVAVASVPESVLSYASTADPIAELLSTVPPLATPTLLRRQNSPFGSAVANNLAFASLLSNPNLNPLSNPLLNPAANPLLNPAVNPAVNPLADPTLANSIAASIASEVVDVAQTAAESAAAAVTSIVTSVNTDIVSDGDLSYPTWLLEGIDPSDPAYIDSLDWDDDDYDAEDSGAGSIVWNNNDYDPNDNVYTNWNLPNLQISTPVEELPTTSDIVVPLLPTSVEPFSFSPTTEYNLPTTPVTNYLSSLNPTIASEIAAVVPTISEGQVLDRRQLEALSSFASRIQQGIPSSVRAAPSAINSLALDKVTNPLELLAKLIGAQASPALNVLASQIQAAPTAGAALVAAQISAIQPILGAIPSAVSSDLAQATSVAGPALAQVSGALEALKSINIPSAIGEVISAVTGIVGNGTRIVGNGTHIVASDIPAVVNAAVSNLSKILPMATVTASIGNPSNPVAVTAAVAVPGFATVRAGAGISALPPQVSSVAPSAGPESSADDEAGLKEHDSRGLGGLGDILSSLVPSAASSSPIAQLLLQLQIAPILFFLPLLLSNPLAVGGSSLNPLLSSLSSLLSPSDDDASASATSSLSSSNPLSALLSSNPLSSVLESTDQLFSLLADSSSDVLSHLAASLTDKWSELFQLALQAQVEAAKLGSEVADVLLSP